VRTPLQILTSISTATAAFALPLALATVAPEAPVAPVIQPMLQELQVIVALAEPEPEPEAEPEPPPKKTAKAQSKTRERPEPDVDPSAAEAQEAGAEIVRPVPLAGSVYARVLNPHHVRPDRTLASTAHRTTRKGKRRKPCVEPFGGITRTGAGRYDVERDLVDYYTRHPGEAETLAATAWHRKDGQIDGFRVKKMRCGSPLYQLGFRNGDVVHSVNGKSVTSTTQALRAFRKVRKDDRLTVRVTSWRGQTKVLRFRMI